MLWSEGGHTEMVDFPSSPTPDQIHTEEGQSWQWKTDRWIVYNPLTIDAIYPVGSVYISVNATNPGSLFQGTTWVAFAAGRAIVGVGTNNDSSWTNGQLRGAEGHVLMQSEMPAHNHDSGSLVNATAGNHNHSVYFNFDGQSGGFESVGANSNGSDVRTTSNAGNHTHSISGNTGTAGGNASHNNVQPSIGVHMWQRTA